MVSPELAGFPGRRRFLWLRSAPHVVVDEHFVAGPFYRDLLPDVLLDRIEIERAFLVCQGDRLSFSPGTRGAADPVDIVLAVLGEVVVDDVGNRVNVQSP